MFNSITVASNCNLLISILLHTQNFTSPSVVGRTTIFFFNNFFRLQRTVIGSIFAKRPTCTNIPTRNFRHLLINSEVIFEKTLRGYQLHSLKSASWLQHSSPMAPLCSNLSRSRFQNYMDILRIHRASKFWTQRRQAWFGETAVQYEDWTTLYGTTDSSTLRNSSNTPNCWHCSQSLLKRV